MSLLLQAILDGACISLPHGSLNECYDELGTRYTIPVYCLSYPINIVADSAGGGSGSGRPDSPAEFSVPVNGEVRIMLKRDDYRVSHPIIHRDFLAKFYGVPPAFGPLLQLATAEAGQGNSQNKP